MQLTQHLASSDLRQRKEKWGEDDSEQEKLMEEVRSGGTPVSKAEGGGAGTGRRQGWSNGSQAAVQRGRSELLLRAATPASDGAEAFIDGA